MLLKIPVHFYYTKNKAFVKGLNSFFYKIRVMYRISVQEEGRSQMSVESNMMKVDSEKSKKYSDITMNSPSRYIIK